MQVLRGGLNNNMLDIKDEPIYKSLSLLLSDDEDNPKAFPDIIWIKGITKITSRNESHFVHIVAIDEKNDEFSYEISINNCNWFGFLVGKKQAAMNMKQFLLTNNSTYVEKIEIYESYWINTKKMEWWLKIYTNNFNAFKKMTQYLESNNHNISDTESIMKSKGHCNKMAFEGIECYRFIRKPLSSCISSDDIIYVEENIPGFYNKAVFDIEVSLDKVLQGDLMPDISFRGNKINVISIYFGSEIKGERYINLALNRFGLDFSMDNTLVCQSEHDIILAFICALKILKPVFTIGYNSHSFDIPWIINRMELHKLSYLLGDIFPQTTFDSNDHLSTDAVKKAMNIYVYPPEGDIKGPSAKQSSGGQGENFILSFFGSATNHLDLMYSVSRNGQYSKATGRGLTAVCEYHGLPIKQEVSHGIMSIYEKIQQAYHQDKVHELKEAIKQAMEGGFVSANQISEPGIAAFIRGEKKECMSRAKEYFMKYIDYCCNDSRITFMLERKLGTIEAAIGLANLTHLPMTKIIYGGISSMVFSMFDQYADKLKEKFYLCTKDELEEKKREMLVTLLEGGRTFSILPKDHTEPIMCMSIDQSSGYPTSTITGHFTAEAMTYEPPEHYVGILITKTQGESYWIYFDNQIKGVCDTLLDDMIKRRRAVKKEMSNAKKREDPQYIIDQLNHQQGSLKKIMVSCYGVLGAKVHIKNPFVDYRICNGIVNLIAGSLELFQIIIYYRFGLVPVKGVTDSLTYYITDEVHEILTDGEENTYESQFRIAKQLSKEIENFVNHFYKLIFGLDSKMNMEIEHISWKLISNAQKRYIMVSLDRFADTFDEAHERGHLDIKGVSPIRRNASDLVLLISEYFKDIVYSKEIYKMSEILDKTKEFIEDNRSNFTKVGSKMRITPKGAVTKCIMSRAIAARSIGYIEVQSIAWGRRVLVVQEEMSYPCVFPNGQQSLWSVGYASITEEFIEEDTVFSVTAIQKSIATAGVDLLGNPHYKESINNLLPVEQGRPSKKRYITHELDFYHESIGLPLLSVVKEFIMGPKANPAEIYRQCISVEWSSQKKAMGDLSESIICPPYLFAEDEIYYELLGHKILYTHYISAKLGSREHIRFENYIGAFKERLRALDMIITEKIESSLFFLDI